MQRNRIVSKVAIYKKERKTIKQNLEIKMKINGKKQNHKVLFSALINKRKKRRCNKRYETMKIPFICDLMQRKAF